MEKTEKERSTLASAFTSQSVKEQKLDCQLNCSANAKYKSNNVQSDWGRKSAPHTQMMSPQNPRQKTPSKFCQTEPELRYNRSRNFCGMSINRQHHQRQHHQHTSNCALISFAWTAVLLKVVGTEGVSWKSHHFSIAPHHCTLPSCLIVVWL